MSTQVIDQKIVEMRFDNENFEKNVSQSMSTLDKLKKSLNFDSIKSLTKLGDATKNVNLNGISTAVDEASNKFSALEIAGVTAIAKITSAAMDAGVKMVKSLSVDQISKGFDKYAEKTQAIQTIISATGEDIATVEAEIDKLNWFTDETSYSLTDMISNIAKFTNAGIKLQDAVPQMMGLAAAAGDAGSGVQGATHAMEGFSKAMSQQYMDRKAWSWMKTAKVDTLRFKQALIDAAVEVGTLTKVADDMYMTLEGHEVSAVDFETNLKDKWLVAEAMSRGLEVYGKFSSILGEVMEQIDYQITTSEMIDYVEQYKEGMLDIEAVSEELNMSAEDLRDIMEELSRQEYDLGNHAFRMSQEAKTFGEAIDSVKDAVSTGWMRTFQYFFGNYEEAKKLWTGLANDLYEAFAESGNT